MRAEEHEPLRGAEPHRSQLSRILKEHPESRTRLKRAVASLGLTFVFAIATLGILLIWHLRRRASLIRESLEPPKDVTLVDPLPGRSPNSTYPNVEST